MVEENRGACGADDDAEQCDDVGEPPIHGEVGTEFPGVLRRVPHVVVVFDHDPIQVDASRHQAPERREGEE